VAANTSRLTGSANCPFASGASNALMIAFSKSVRGADAGDDRIPEPPTGERHYPALPAVTDDVTTPISHAALMIRLINQQGPVLA
jgi:hypothetical protein